MLFGAELIFGSIGGLWVCVVIQIKIKRFLKQRKVVAFIIGQIRMQVNYANSNEGV